MCDDKRKALDDVFNMFDLDRSGKIDTNELRAALTEYYKCINENPGAGQIDEDVQAIMLSCDASGDGKIDKAEWFKFFEC